MRILRDPVPPLLADGVPLALSDLLVESMAKNPLKRPSSALEFADRLKRIEVAQAWPSTSYFVVDGAAYRFLEPMPADEDGAGDDAVVGCCENGQSGLEGPGCGALHERERLLIAEYHRDRVERAVFTPAQR